VALALGLEHLHEGEGGGGDPDEEGEGAEGDVCLGGVADVAAAEEQALQEDGEGHEAREVEEHVCDVEGGCDVGLGDCKGGGLLVGAFFGGV